MFVVHTHTNTHTHARTHARMHASAHAHEHTHARTCDDTLSFVQWDPGKKMKFLVINLFYTGVKWSVPTWEGSNRKRYQPSTNVDQKSIETIFSIAICRQCCDKWQSKTLFLKMFDLRSSIVLVFSIAAYPVWYQYS